MRRTAAARTSTGRVLRIVVAALSVVMAASGAALGHQVLASTSSTSTSVASLPWPLSSTTAPRLAATTPPADPGHEPHGAAPGAADGAVPDGTTPFDDEVPGVANLDPDLLRALRRAAAGAADDGIVLHVNSGWRSPEYQDQLLREAVAEHGSAEEAARWVATAETSAHVSGDAVDIGPSEAASWLSEHGAGYGLCPIYGNEPWHYELRPQAIGHGCPPLYPDPTHDPRMQP